MAKDLAQVLITRLRLYAQPLNPSPQLHVLHIPAGYWSTTQATYCFPMKTSFDLCTVLSEAVCKPEPFMVTSCPGTRRALGKSVLLSLDK